MKIASWIPVTERLPEPSRNHLCVSKGETELWTIAYYLGEERWLLAIPEEEPMNYHSFVIEGGITHWFDPATLPLSPAPHGDEDGSSSLHSILRDECDRRDQEMGNKGV